MGLLEIILILLLIGAFGGGIHSGNNILHVLAVVLLIILLFRLVGGVHGIP